MRDEARLSAWSRAAATISSLIPSPSSLARFRPARPVYKTWWGASVALVLVAGGVAAGALTFLAGQTGDAVLAYYGAIACLSFVVLITIFVVPPLMLAARAEVRAIDFPIRLTWGGLLFIVVLVSVVLAAWNTGSNVLFLIFSVMVSTLFVQWAAARVVLRDTGVAARFPDHIFAGEPAPITATLHNYKRVLPSLFISIEARESDATFGVRGKAPDGKTSSAMQAKRATLMKLVARKQATPTKQQRKKIHTPSAQKIPTQARHLLARFDYVGRRGKAEQPVERTFARRGEVRITGFTLSTVFPFGLFELRRRLRARDVRLVIYPRVEAVRARFNLPPRRRAMGESLATRRGQGADLYALRTYQAGDDRRHIDWKATARTRRLTVREFAADEHTRAHIVFDARRYDHETAPDEWSMRFEQGVTRAASLVAHFIRQGGEVALTIRGNGEDVESHPVNFGGDQAHLYAALRRLALVAPTTNTAHADSNEFLDNLASHLTVEGAHLILVTAAPARRNLPHAAHVVGY